VENMDKEQLKELLKEMFIDGDFEIVTELKEDWDGKCIVTSVKIDGHTAYEHKEHISYSVWNK
jgi:hypothetical protein